MKRILRLLLAALLFAGMASGQASCRAEDFPGESPWIQLLDFTSLYGASRTAGDPKPEFSTRQQWLPSLAYKADPSLWLIGTANGSYEKSQLFIAQEEGSRESNELLAQNFSFAVKKNFSDAMVFRPLFYHGLNYVKETRDESIGKGLYDYEDLGGGFENTHTFGEAPGDARILVYGLNVFHREYPHFRSLLSEFDPNRALEENEKDFVGVKLNAGWEEAPAKGPKGRFEYVFLFKDFIDKKTIDRNGIRKDDGREDFYNEFRTTLAGTLMEGIVLEGNFGLSANFSNLDFYDTRNTATLADDRFFEDYYDYLSFTVSPGLLFEIPFGAPGEKTQLLLSFAFDALYYPGRNALEKNGDLMPRNQRDFGHTFSAVLSIPLTRQLKWQSQASYKDQDSNQKFEDYYRYNYELWSLLSGISFAY